MSKAYITAYAGNLISFSAGTVITWSSPEIEILKSVNSTPFDVPITSPEAALVSSLFTLGAIFGPFLFGYLADVIGRKPTLLTCGVPFVICYLLLAFGKVLEIYYLARFIFGMCLGGVFTVVPMYIGEIADKKNRGALSSMLNVFLCAGMLFSYAMGPYLSVKTFNLMLAVFPVLYLVLFYIIAPESPQYYLMKNKQVLAKKSLQHFRENGDVNDELATIQKKIKDEGKGSITDIFKSKGLRRAFRISVGLVAFQQFTGINAVFLYAQTIFEQAGSTIDPAVCSIIIGIVQFLTSFLIPVLIDRLGRKVLLLVSAVGMVLSEIPLGIYSYLKDHNHDVSSISFLPVICLVVYIITYNFGYGPLPWTIMGEIFPTNVKSIASSLTAGICWALAFLVSYSFESVSNTIGMGPSFWIFSVCCIFAVPFSYYVVIETKGKSLEQIQDELNS